MLTRFLSILLICLTFGCQIPSSELKPKELLQKYRGAVVRVVHKDTSCSAFYVGDDLIVTAKHCIGDDAEPDLTIEDVYDPTQKATLIYVDPNNDVIVLRSENPLDASVSVMSSDDPPLELGQEVVTMGYPGYYGLDFIFEVGYLGEYTTIKKHQFILGMNLAYPGESGGPVFSTKDGKVIGMAVAVAEKIQVIDKKTKIHQHHSISIILPWNIIQKAIDHAKLEISS